MDGFKPRPIFAATKDADALLVPCATCGAGVGEGCELNTGAPRTGPHMARRIDAKEWIKNDKEKAQG